MKRFVGIILGTFLVSSVFTAKAHAFTLDDLMSQVASLRAEVIQLKSNLGAQAIGAVDTKATSSSDQKPVTVMTSTNPIAAGVNSSTTVTSNQSESSFRANNPRGYWVVERSTGKCLWQILPPGQGNTSCLPPIIVESVTTSTNNTSKNLSYGDKQSVDVLNLQIDLKTRGYLTANPNGSFGPATLAAVKALQTANGLPATGTVDAKTKAVISVNTTTTPNTETKVKVDIDTYIKNIPNQIASLQAVLKNPAAFKAQTLASAPTTAPTSSTGRAPGVDILIVQGTYNCLIYDWYPGLGGWYLTGYHAGECAEGSTGYYQNF